MTFNNIPPQAFTREDVTKAYLWIQTQPEDVRKLATSKDALVSLYLQARRNGTISNDQINSLSTKSFRKDLESIATELKQFESAENAKASAADTKELPPMGPHPNYTQPLSQSQQQSPPKDFLEKTVQEFKQPSPIERSLPAPENKGLALELDPRSEQIIRSVKAQLNMESEKDIIRMLLVLGYDRIKAIFPSK